MRKTGRIHAATKVTPRLQRVLKLLRDRGDRGATTREIIEMALVCAVNTCIAELRELGFPVQCTMEGRGRFRYKLAKPEIPQAKDGEPLFPNDHGPSYRPGPETSTTDPVQPDLWEKLA